MNGNTFNNCTCGYKYPPVKVMINGYNGKKYWMVYCRFCHKEMKADNYYKLIDLWNKEGDKNE